MTKAFISGCAGLALSDEERVFFSREKPWGLILFARNCENPSQIRSLIDDFRSCLGRDNAPVLIDQEGGRVQRLRAPHWREYPPGRVFGALEDARRGDGVDVARHVSHLLASELYDLDITVDCLPILDVRQPEGHAVIGDRAYGDDPATVAAIGRAVMDGLRAGGVLPIIKHIPGHGRGRVDSHLELPTVEASLDELRAVDFPPFAALADAPMAMTAHIIFTAIDATAPVTHSRKAIDRIVRDEIGFDGLLMSDDVSMEALAGSISERAAVSLAAGCDIALHCNGDIAEMREVAAVTPELAGDSLRRASDALAWAKPPDPVDQTRALAALSQAKLVA